MHPAHWMCGHAGGNQKMKKTLFVRIALICAALSIGPLTAWASDSDQATPQPEGTPAPPALLPGMAGPLAFSAKPLSYDVPHLGTVYLTGVASGLGFWQAHPLP